MQLPKESSSSWVHVSFASYCRSALLAGSRAEQIFPAPTRERLGVLAAALETPLHTVIKETRETQDAQFLTRPESMAEQESAFLGLRLVTNGALNAFRTALGGSDDHPGLRQVFPNLMRTLNDAPLDERSVVADEIAARLERRTEEFVGKAEHIARIRSAAARAKASFESADTAYAGWKHERGEEIVAKGELRLALERTYGSLRDLFPAQRDVVESFFPRPDARSANDDTPPTPAT